MSSSLLQLSICRIPFLTPPLLQVTRGSYGCTFVSRKTYRISKGVSLRSQKELLAAAEEKNKDQRLCAIDGDGQSFDVSDADKQSTGHEGSEENNGSRLTNALTSTELMQRLKRYGISGILSYGLLNTAYYLVTFILVWFYVAPAPGRMGYAAAVERFFKVMMMVWAGSQVTKLVRVGGALALAPFVDRGLSWFTVKFKFHSQWKAFMAIVGFCFGLALLLFFVVTLLWA